MQKGDQGHSSAAAVTEEESRKQTKRARLPMPAEVVLTLMLRRLLPQRERRPSATPTNANTGGGLASADVATTARVCAVGHARRQAAPAAFRSPTDPCDGCKRAQATNSPGPPEARISCPIAPLSCVVTYPCAAAANGSLPTGIRSAHPPPRADGW